MHAMALRRCSEAPVTAVAEAVTDAEVEADALAPVNRDELRRSVTMSGRRQPHQARANQQIQQALDAINEHDDE